MTALVIQINTILSIHLRLYICYVHMISKESFNHYKSKCTLYRNFVKSKEFIYIYMIEQHFTKKHL